MGQRDIEKQDLRAGRPEGRWCLIYTWWERYTAVSGAGGEAGPPSRGECVPCSGPQWGLGVWLECEQERVEAAELCEGGWGCSHRAQQAAGRLRVLSCV